MNRALHRFLPLVLVLLAGGAPTAPPEREAGLAGLEGAVMDAVNAHRAAKGLQALARDGALTEIARGHSEDMASGRVAFGHAGFRARVETVRARVPYSHLAENVSRHRRPREGIPSAALAAWLKSARHRKNLEGDYERSGVGAARAEDGVIYLTQIFVRR